MKRIFLSLFLILTFLNASITNAGAPETFVVMGSNPVMERVPVANTSQLLSAAFNAAYSGTDPDWNSLKAVTVKCESYAVRISFGRAAASGVTPMGFVLYVGESYRFPSMDLARKAYIINETSGSVGYLMTLVER